MKEVLKLEHIQKHYGDGSNITTAIQDISFDVKEGEFVGIMGASGSGKTTLLNCISTIDTATAGHIYLDGTDVTKIKENEIVRFRRTNLGFVFQDFNLLDTLTISENIALALTINRILPDEIESRVQDMAAKLNIRKMYDHTSSQVDFSMINGDIGGIEISVFREYEDGKIVREDWEPGKFINTVNTGVFEVEFITQYKSDQSFLFKCWIWFDEAPYHSECEIIINCENAVYSWNQLRYDCVW